MSKAGFTYAQASACAQGYNYHLLCPRLRACPTLRFSYILYVIPKASCMSHASRVPKVSCMPVLLPARLSYSTEPPPSTHHTKVCPCYSLPTPFSSSPRNQKNQSSLVLYLAWRHILLTGTLARYNKDIMYSYPVWREPATRENAM